MHTETQKSTTVAIHSDVARGAATISYELAPDRIVEAIRADLHAAKPGADPAADAVVRAWIARWVGPAINL